MSQAALRKAKRKIDAIVAGYQKAAGLKQLSVLGKLTPGKVYEAWVLCEVLERLHADEGFEVHMIGSTEVRLKSHPSPIKPGYPHFEVVRPGERYDVWTDIEFLTLSHYRRGAPAPERGDYHELDILVVEHGATGCPRHDQILIGVECKNTPFTKGLLRAILGVRRELSLLSQPHRSPFKSWPRTMVPADPESCLLLYCTRAEVLEYDAPGETFGIDFKHEALP